MQIPINYNGTHVGIFFPTLISAYINILHLCDSLEGQVWHLLRESDLVSVVIKGSVFV